MTTQQDYQAALDYCFIQEDRLTGMNNHSTHEDAYRCFKHYGHIICAALTQCAKGCGDDAPKEYYSAYYYGFESTGNSGIDAILKAVAAAGEGHHHTENWADTNGDNPSYVDNIQSAANEAAKLYRTQKGD